MESNIRPEAQIVINEDSVQKRQERRQRQKEEDPEYTKRENQKRREQSESIKRQLFNDTFDRMFAKYKHTFPNPVSSFLWEKLKKDEIDFLFNRYFFPEGNSLHELYEDRDIHIKELREDPNHPCAGSLIFYIKTLVHRPKDQRKLTKKELEWLYNFEEMEKIEKPVYKISVDKEKKQRQNREYNAKTKTLQKNQNLNLRFMKADPNKVLSVDEITNDPFPSKNHPIREQHKIDLWKADKNPEFLEKWRKQREEYEKEVEKLSIEYKEEFLKNNK